MSGCYFSETRCIYYISRYKLYVSIFLYAVAYRWASITSRRRSYLAATWPRCRERSVCSATRRPLPRHGQDSTASSTFSSPNVPSSIGLCRLISLLGPFYGAIAFPSVTRCRCRRRRCCCCGHRHAAARSGEWAQNFSNASCLKTHLDKLLLALVDFSEFRCK